MSSLSHAVTSTLNYAAYFDYPLSIKELHHWLITKKIVSEKTLIKTLPSKIVVKLTKTSIKRSQRYILTEQKLNTLNPVLKFLKLIPTINLIAVTGSLAMDNAKEDDDIDLMVVTSNNTLWLTRLFVMAIISLFSRRRHPNELHQPNTICLNLWLDGEALLIPKAKQNLYIAHEVLQVKPLYNKKETYQKFILLNSWTKNYLANAYHLITSKFSSSHLLKREVKQTKQTSILSTLNLFAFKLQYLYMRSKITREYVTPHEAYFHPRDLNANINRHLKHD